jgi:hypothetical protein
MLGLRPRAGGGGGGPARPGAAAGGGGARGGAAAPQCPWHGAMRMRPQAVPNAVLVYWGAGYGISEAVKRRGLLEDTRLGLELAVTAVFEAMRTAIRAALFLPRQPAAAQHEVRVPWEHGSTCVERVHGLRGLHGLA